MAYPLSAFVPTKLYHMPLNYRLHGAAFATSQYLVAQPLPAGATRRAVVVRVGGLPKIIAFLTP